MRMRGLATYRSADRSRPHDTNEQDMHRGTFPMNRRDAMVSMLAAAGTVLAPAVVRAQAGFPSRTIRIVVPVAAGGGVDVFARLIANKIKVLRDVGFIV